MRVPGSSPAEAAYIASAFEPSGVPVLFAAVNRVGVIGTGSSSSHTVVVRAAALRHSAAALALPAVRCGGSVSGPFGFTNQDPTASINVTSLAVSGPNAASVTLSGLPTLPVHLLPGQTLTGTATLTTSTCGAKSATITATSDDPWDETAAVTVTGYGYVPVLGTSALSLSFGVVGVGTNSVVQDLSVYNDGDGPMAFSLVGIQGGSATSFAITLNSCTTTLAPGGACGVEIAFEPNAVGAVSSSLYINTDGGFTYIPLSGTGVNLADVGLVAAWPATVTHGVAATATVTVFDVGPAPATGLTATVGYPTGTTVTVTGTGWTCTKTATQATCTNPFLLAGQSSKLTVKLTFPAAGSAVVTGSVTASGTVDPNASNNTVGTTLTVT